MPNKIITALIAFFLPFAAFADKPTPWQFGFQEAVTPTMHAFNDFHNILLYVIFAVSAFVLLLLVYVCIKFSAKNNPVPSKNSHNTVLEVIWTVLPVVILVFLAIPSMRVLYFNEKIENTEMTLKIVGHQWYWSYAYPDNGDIEFESYMIPDDEIKEGQTRLLEVDNRVVLPVDTKIKLQITGADVIHNWAMPAFGVKIDAIPGRLNEGWIEVEKTGTYYGQCSELCGVGHGFMPIAVDVVSKAEFAAWVRGKTNKLAENEVNDSDDLFVENSKNSKKEEALPPLESIASKMNIEEK